METLNLDEQFFEQPTINIGMIGSVSNGKSSITEKLTRENTLRHSHERKRDITMKLGYANCKIYKCESCEPPECYQSFSCKTVSACCEICGDKMELQKHISIVDCPGHNLLTATMLNGTSVMDTTILVESVSNKKIPAPQTEEHLIAASITGLKNDIVCMNKLDLVPSKIDCMEKIDKFKEYLTGTIASNSPIVPIVANYELNKDVLCQYICEKIAEPKRDLESNAKMIIIRSFNVNRQNVPINDMKGGVIGGTIMKGILKTGDRVEILPGLVKNSLEDEDTVWTFEPIISKVESISSKENSLDFAIPGGLLGVQLTIDPALTSKDRLIGNILKVINNDKSDFYKIYEVLFVRLELLERNNGQQMELRKNDQIVVNYNACNISCQVKKVKNDHAEIILLEKPICVENGDYITISKNVNSSIVIIGRAEIVAGTKSKRKVSINEEYI